MIINCHTPFPACRSDSQESYALLHRFSYAALIGLDISKNMGAAGVSGQSSVHVMGLSVSVTDEHLVLTTACGRMLLLNVPAAMAAMNEAADRPANAATTATAAAAVLDASASQAGQVALQVTEGRTEAPCGTDDAAPDAAVSGPPRNCLVLLFSVLPAKPCNAEHRWPSTAVAGGCMSVASRSRDNQSELLLVLCAGGQPLRLASGLCRVCSCSNCRPGCSTASAFAACCQRRPVSWWQLQLAKSIREIRTWHLKMPGPV